MTDALYPDRAEPSTDGSTRKAHYGEGERLGWGPAFAATCVLRYLRRDKAREHSLESARWYYDQLYARAAQPLDGPTAPWSDAINGLEAELTQAELRFLRMKIL